MKPFEIETCSFLIRVRVVFAIVPNSDQLNVVDITNFRHLAVV